MIGTNGFLAPLNNNNHYHKINNRINTNNVNNIMSSLSSKSAVMRSTTTGKSSTCLHGTNGPCVGIDLGTTYSCVGVWKNGRVEICTNEQGNRITPSYVSWSADGSQRLIGDAAKSQAASNPKNTIFDVKRLIGRKFSDPSVQKDKKLFPFTLVDRSGKPHIKATVNSEEKILAPEEISAMILTKMKQIAETFAGQEVKSAE